jgi:hypothetical protein
VDKKTSLLPIALIFLALVALFAYYAWDRGLLPSFGNDSDDKAILGTNTRLSDSKKSQFVGMNVQAGPRGNLMKTKVIQGNLGRANIIGIDSPLSSKSGPVNYNSPPLDYVPSMSLQQAQIWVLARGSDPEKTAIRDIASRLPSGFTTSSVSRSAWNSASDAADKTVFRGSLPKLPIPSSSFKSDSKVPIPLIANPLLWTARLYSWRTFLNSDPSDWLKTGEPTPGPGFYFTPTLSMIEAHRAYQDQKEMEKEKELIRFENTLF